MWALLAAALLASQSQWERNYDCWEHDTDLGAACWADVRALYAAPPIEELQRRGVQVRRIYFLDLVGRIPADRRGHDTQAGMISIERMAGEAPRLIYYPARRQGIVVTPLAAGLSAADWDRVIAGTGHVQGWTVDGGDICLHGWDLLVEAADPGAPVERRQERTCYAGRALWFATLTARLAVDVLQPCGTLPRDDLWFQIEWLHRCSLQPRARS